MLVCMVLLEERVYRIEKIQESTRLSGEEEIWRDGNLFGKYCQEG